jgi:ankyrin repeat protein
LLYAAENGHGAAVKVLADAGAKLNAVENDGNAAVMLAEAKGHGAVVRALAEAGGRS